MSKEITRAILLQQLQDRFKLRDYEAEKFLFAETVVPVFDVREELQVPTIVTSQKSITAGPAAYVFYDVPQNEQWRLNRYDIVFMGAGAYTVTGLFWYRPTSVTDSIYLDMKAGQTTSYHVTLPFPVILPPTARVSVYVDGYTSPQNLRVYLEYTKEEIR